MSRETVSTLIGWLLRDAFIATLVAALVAGLHATADGHLAARVLAGVLGWVGAYVVCYVTHEWGHWLGARFAGARLPLGPYKGILLGLFDVSAHSRRQFIWMSIGGVAGYTVVAVLALALWLVTPSAATAGVAVGGLFFVAQSWAVDLPIIVRVSQGAALEKTATEGARPQVIARRTWQTWVPLTAILGLFAAL